MITRPCHHNPGRHATGNNRSDRGGRGIEKTEFAPQKPLLFLMLDTTGAKGLGQRR